MLFSGSKVALPDISVLEVLLPRGQVEENLAPAILLLGEDRGPLFFLFLAGKAKEAARIGAPNPVFRRVAFWWARLAPAGA